MLNKSWGYDKQNLIGGNYRSNSLVSSTKKLQGVKKKDEGEAIG